MNLTMLSPETRHFLEAEVAAGVYPSVESAVEAAVSRLRLDQEWSAAANDGFRELEAGLGKAYCEETLARRFDELRAIVRRRMKAAGASE
jgi:Arc/MetJ-type ribon-helix-helix transcriptional regulator